MIKLILVFLAVCAAVYGGAVFVKSMRPTQRTKLMKIVAYGILTAVTALLILSIVVILF